MVYNADTVNHKVIIEFVRSAAAYVLFGVTIGPGDTLVQDVPIVLTNDADTLRAKLGEAMTTTQPQAVTTYATIS